VRDTLRLAGVEDAIGADRFYPTLDAGVTALSSRDEA